MNYRADVDGLRAVAILLVLLYHGGFPLFPSGFIGVDVFFIISGFLITGIIHQSLTDNRFSFVDFYNRRLWRLQPVLFLFMIIATALALVFFLPDDLVQYSKAARKVSLFMANVFFNKTTTAYFAPDTQQLPLLHTWSLAIEWQCYLLLPLVIYGLHRFLKHYLWLAVLILMLGSFLLSLHYSHSVPAQTYFQLSSRIFEFLIGSCIALMPANKSAPQSLLNGLSFLAFATLVYVASREHILLGYPNTYALAVCVATAALIYIGTHYPGVILVKCLTFKPLVFIGLISYSLYLWHWLFLALLRYQSIPETPAVLIMVYGCIFATAYCSWRFIEVPARQYKTVRFHTTAFCFLLMPIVFTHLAAYLIKTHQGFPQRFNEELIRVYRNLERYASKERPLCIGTQKHQAPCLIGSAKTDAKKALMIGDSFSNHYWGFMDVVGKKAHTSILARGTSSCLMLPGIYLYDWWHFKNQVYQECYARTQKAFELVQSQHYDYVIIGQIWSNYLSDKIVNQPTDTRSLDLSKKRLTHALDNALAQITASGAKPVLIKTSALMEKNFHDCFFKHIKLRQAYDPEQCNFNLVLSDSERWFEDLFSKMQKKYPSLKFIDPKTVQCEQGRCKADINGVPMYRDVGHITDYASYHLGKLYLQRCANPLG